MDEVRLNELRKLADRGDALSDLAPDDVRAMVAEIQQLRGALRAFLKLNWAPDAAPGPSYYLVEPVGEARRTLQTAGILLDGRSPFSSDNDGSLMFFVERDGTRRRSVWLGGRAYPDDRPELVPDQHRAKFQEALRSAGA